MSLSLTNMGGFGGGPGRAPMTVTKVGQSEATGNSPYSLFGSLSLDAGYYVAVISCRHNSGTGSRYLSGFAASGTGGSKSTTTHIGNSRTSGGIGVVSISSFSTDADTNITITATYDGNLTACHCWLYKVENAIGLTAHDTGESDGSTFTLNTTGIDDGILFAVIQATNGVTASGSLGTYDKDAQVYPHETDGFGQVFTVDDLVTGLGETTTTWSGDTTNRLSCGCIIY